MDHQKIFTYRLSVTKLLHNERKSYLERHIDLSDVPCRAIFLGLPYSITPDDDYFIETFELTLNDHQH